MHKTALAILLIAATSASAQVPSPAPAAPPFNVHRAEGAIKIDGDLSDAGWKNAATWDQFVEGQPGNNTPAKVKTTVYLTYDDRYFYIGVRCEDPDPKKIRAPYPERDNVIGTDDNMAIFLDTRNDHRTSMELRVNPRGIQADGIYNDAGPTEDFSPDYFYDTASKIDAAGWSTEFAIPFTSLRYPDSDTQVWNILVWRNYPREFRYAFYNTPVPRDSNCLVCHAVPILGLTGLPRAGHLIAAPYVTGEQAATPEGDVGTSLERQPFKGDAGLDVKWTPTANHVLDMTINPDFSQVESDIAQITTNQRFAVFYPEKRPFFLEGFDLFDTPLQVAYTRTVTSPAWGGRSTGKFLGSSYTILVTEDRGGGLTIIPGPLGSSFAPQDFKSIDMIGRLRHDIGGRSFVGLAVTDREIKDGGYNRVIGPDFQWRPTETDAITGEFLYSSTENPDRPDLSPVWDGKSSKSYAFHADWNRVKEKYDAGVAVNDFGDDFRADLGFIPQVGYREFSAFGGLRFFPEHSWASFIRPSVAVDKQVDLDGNTIYRRSSTGIFIQGFKNLGIGVVLHPEEQNRVGDQVLTENFFEWQFTIDPSRRFSRIALNGVNGQRIDYANGRVGDGGTLTLTATVKPIDKLAFDAVVSREWLDVTGGQLYSSTVNRLKMLYSFTAKSLLRVIGQYVSTDRNPGLYTFPVRLHDSQFDGSILYSYKLNWQTVLYAGYGDDRELTDAYTMAQTNRSLFVKISYAFQQ